MCIEKFWTKWDQEYYTHVGGYFPLHLIFFMSVHIILLNPFWELYGFPLHGHIFNYVLFSQSCTRYLGFPGGSVVKNLPANTGDTGSIPGSGRSPGGGNDNTLQYSCLGNTVDRGAWQATVHGVTKELNTTQQLSNNNTGYFCCF